MHRTARLAALLSLLALPFAFAPNASASVTLGQLATSAPNDCSSGSPVELLQPTVTSGASYVSPADGTITSWSTVGAASGGGGQMKLKVWRKVSDPVTFQVVTQSNFEVIPTATLKTFPVTLPGIQAGDVLGLTFQGVSKTGCNFGVTGDSFRNAPGDFANGDGTIFSATALGSRIDISATLDPSHKFGLGALTRDKKHGTATLQVSVPGPGQVTATGNGVKSPGASATAKGDVGVLIKAKGKKKRALLGKGKVALNVTLTYTPTGGAAGTDATNVKLKKKL